MKRSRLMQLLVLAVLLSACDQGDGYPSEVVQNFMNACTQGGGSDKACTCVIERLQDEMPLDEFVEFEAQVNAGEELPSEVTDIIESCRSA
jgi:hypothetical protein